MVRQVRLSDPTASCDGTAEEPNRNHHQEREMKGPVVASQWSEMLNVAVRNEVANIELVPIAENTLADVPPGVTVLAAAPFRRVDGEFAPQPAGWPFDLRWIQLSSVGLDAYPAWLFDGPMVTSARGTSAIALAEFAIAAVLAAAKRLPDIWIDSSERWRPAPLDILNGRTLGLLGFGSTG